MTDNILLLPQLSAQFIQGNNSDWLDKIQLTLPDGVTPIDLTGLTFRITIRQNADDVITILELSTTDGTLLNGGTNGVITFNVPALTLLRLSAGDYVMDLIARNEAGTTVNLFMIAPAKLTLTQGVTRDLNEMIVDYLSWLVPSMPTTPPDKAGVLWQNNGVICVSGLRDSLPIKPPVVEGKLWNNGGVVCITGEGGAQVLPTLQPDDTGYLWNNGGVVCVT